MFDSNGKVAQTHFDSKRYNNILLQDMLNLTFRSSFSLPTLEVRFNFLIFSHIYRKRFDF